MASHMDHAIIQSKREKRYPELVTLGGGGGGEDTVYVWIT